MTYVISTLRVKLESVEEVIDQELGLEKLQK